MKAIKNTQSKLKNLEYIQILDNSYKLSKLHYPINDKDWFEFIGVRFEYNKKFITLGLLKTIIGVIQNKKFTYEDLNKELRLDLYLHDQEIIKFINEHSLRINNKNWFNCYIEDSHPIGCESSTINHDLINETDGKIKTEELLKTCIIHPYTMINNYKFIPIYHCHGSKHFSTQIICIFEIITDLLSRKFPSLASDLSHLSTQELNKSELNNSTLSKYRGMNEEELIKLLEEKDSKINKLESKNKSNSKEETEKLYDKYTNESELFRNEVKRYMIETQKQFIVNYLAERSWLFRR